MTRTTALMAFLCSIFVVKGYSQQNELSSPPASNTGLSTIITDSSDKDGLATTPDHAVTVTDDNNKPIPSFFDRLFSKRQKRQMRITDDSVASAPFTFGDFTWLNGTSRKTSPPAVDSKFFTGDFTFDINYTHSYNKPIDNTVVGSTALARNNELQVAFVGIGGDFHVDHVRGRIMMQL